MKQLTLSFPPEKFKTSLSAFRLILRPVIDCVLHCISSSSHEIKTNFYLTMFNTSGFDVLMIFSGILKCRVDPARIREVGPDKAASEWLLRCGAAVRFSGFEKWNVDYNLLPTGRKGQFVIEEVDATDSSIMHIGFEYFRE